MSHFGVLWVFIPVLQAHTIVNLVDPRIDKRMDTPCNEWKIHESELSCLG